MYDGVKHVCALCEWNHFAVTSHRCVVGSELYPVQLSVNVFLLCRSIRSLQPSHTESFKALKVVAACTRCLPGHCSRSASAFCCSMIDWAKNQKRSFLGMKLLVQNDDDVFTDCRKWKCDDYYSGAKIPPKSEEGRLDYAALHLHQSLLLVINVILSFSVD